jgi:hypothetical protein
VYRQSRPGAVTERATGDIDFDLEAAVHKTQRHEYLGQPGELVRLATVTHNGGRVRVTLDGEDLGDVRTFSLPSEPGRDRHLHIDLAGPLGASCGIGISVVDGGTDGDFLLCQPLNPTPFSDYAFNVASEESVAAFGALVGIAPRAVERKAKAKKRKSTKPGAKKSKKAKRGR